MSANTAFQMVNEQGWRRGFANLLRHENAIWWRSRRWWVNVLIWLVLINGVLLATLSSPSMGNMEALATFAAVVGFFTGIGAIVTIQGAIIDEKKSGTAAWIASKPVSRSAFILAKLVANVVAMLVITLVIQGAVAYLQFAANGGAPALGPFVFGLALVGLHLLFYLALTLMLGTLFNERGAVIAIPLGILFGGQFLMGYLGSLSEFLPWYLVMGPTLSSEAMLGQPLSTITPIPATIVWIVVFIGIAIWRYQREEF